MLSVFDIIERLLLILATTSLFGIVFLAYLRVKNNKMLFTSIGFGSFVLYAFLGVPEIFGQTFHVEENVHLLLHLIGLTFVLLGILKD